VLLAAHGARLARLDLRRGGPQRVRPLDGAAHPALGHDLQNAGAGQEGDVAVQAARRHVLQLGGELAGGQRPVAEERLDDAQPHRVQQQVSACHPHSLAIVRSFATILISENVTFRRRAGR
jgi:hypothetical protein